MRVRLCLLVAIVCLVVAACSKSERELLVSAAASLGEAFADIEDEFEALHPDVDVLLNLGGSPTLANQIAEGAPVDVFASADELTVGTLDPEVLTGEPAIFATNRIQIVVTGGNPGGVTGLVSLENEDLLAGSCDFSVPCGRLTEVVLVDAGLTVDFDTFEANVTAVLSKVRDGELDVGLVYVTENTTGLEVIEVGSERITSYPIVSVSGSSDAEAFVEFVLSSAGQGILAGYGFGSP